MTSPLFNVLFICTGNSARSILAEGLLNHYGSGRFRAYSAGSQPKGAVHPLALEVLANIGIPTDEFSSKSWHAFSQPDAPQMNFVFTVCDNAAGEICPVWPGQPVTAHWGVYDPAGVTGTTETQRRAFEDVAQMLKRRIDLMLALPEPSLSSMSIQSQLNAIGKI
jgi:arsenate reductase (thioredoxin)